MVWCKIDFNEPLGKEKKKMRGYGDSLLVQERICDCCNVSVHHFLSHIHFAQFQSHKLYNQAKRKSSHNHYWKSLSLKHFKCPKFEAEEHGRGKLEATTLRSNPSTLTLPIPKTQIFASVPKN